jgi:phosphatidate cytidylyltransferase
MSNLLQRTITGVIFGVIVIGCILFSKFTFALLLLVICALGLKEFYKLSLSKADKRYSNFALIFGTLSLFLCIFSDLFLDTPLNAIRYYYLFVTLVLSFVGFSILDIFWNKEPYAGKMLLGLLLIPFSLIALWQMSYYSMGIGYITGSNCVDGSSKTIPDYFYEIKIPLSLLVLTWANDVGAYFSGKFLGKRKLFERISPNKTWAGFYGGTILTIAVLFVLQNNLNFISYGGGIIATILLGITISTFATFGDLYQSYTKRIHKVKDSGNILPGHGGIWDRFDGFFFVIYGYFLFNLISSLF